MPDLVTILTDGEEETGCRNKMGLTPLSPVRESRLLGTHLSDPDAHSSYDAADGS